MNIVDFVNYIHYLHSMKRQHINELRAFNRFYTNVIGLLDRHILNSQYSLIEARILFEIYHRDDVTSSEIIALLGIDKGYLSRILKKFEKNKLINKVDSKTDKRVATLQISAKGKEEFKILNKASDKQAEAIFKNLSEAECDELIQKIAAIQTLLEKGISHD